MEEILKTNDAVLLSFVEALLKDAGIPTQIFDQNMSIIEGSIGILPRRLLVSAGHADEARAVLTEAGMANEVSRPPKRR